MPVIEKWSLSWILGQIETNLSPGLIAAIISCFVLVWLTLKFKSFFDGLIVRHETINSDLTILKRQQRKIIKIHKNCKAIPANVKFILIDRDKTDSDLPEVFHDD